MNTGAVFLQLLPRWFCISITFLFPLCSPVASPLVVALESLRHEQLPEVLRGEFLHILAVVVNLPCWRVATWINAPPHKNTRRNTHTYVCAFVHRNAHKQVEVEEGEGFCRTTKHQISEEQNKRKGSECCQKAEERWTARNSRERGGSVEDWVNKL